MNGKHQLSPKERMRAIRLVKKCHKMPLLYRMLEYVEIQTTAKGSKENPYEIILNSILEAHEADPYGFYSYGVKYLLTKWEVLLKYKFKPLTV